VRPVRTWSPALNARVNVRVAWRVVPRKASTVSDPVTALAAVRNRPQRPGSGSRVVVFVAPATQPKISAFVP
jgi:hypothetical protein